MTREESSARRTNLLLMTATINPTNSPSLVRTDPAVRLEDYRKALDFYIGNLEIKGGVIEAIIFAENSDSDVSSLKQLARDRGADDRVEFIANYGDHSLPGQDRTLGENVLTDHVVAVSRFIAEAGDRAVIWKITGRYQVANLKQMVDTAPGNFDVYCDLRKRPMHWMDLRFIAWTPVGYRKLLSNMGERFGTEPKEPLMYDYMAALDDAAVVKRYRREPLVNGVRGWNGIGYANGTGLIKYIVRNTSRRIFPNLWI